MKLENVKTLNDYIEYREWKVENNRLLLHPAFYDDNICFHLSDEFINTMIKNTDLFDKTHWIESNDKNTNFIHGIIKQDLGYILPYFINTKITEKEYLTENSFFISFEHKIYQISAQKEMIDYYNSVCHKRIIQFFTDYHDKIISIKFTKEEIDKLKELLREL